MSLTESMVEDAALEWFGELGDAGRRLDPAIPEDAWATDKESLSVPRRIARSLKS